eukprot:c8403_g1_i1.p1 GENE.c8403_g1_i1~~c8403_g1_i1.p1  ORF type:complete len:300 (+),score=87.83 c8403_g1_i1:241-1140(+)
MAAEVLELAGNCSRDLKKKRIVPRHILLALKSDEEFDTLMTKHGITIPEGGVMPNIHSSLLKTSSSAVSQTQDSDAEASPKPASPAPAKKAKAKAEPKKKSTKKAQLQKAATFEQLGQKRLFLGQNLKITKSNIAKYDKCEAVVHPTNSSLSTGGQVGSELLKYGGAAFQQEIDNKRREVSDLQETECCSTGGGELNAKYVIHCNSPSWMGQQSVDELKRTIMNVLQHADSNNIKSVALPSIGSGHNNFPKDVAARAILQTIDGYFQSIMSSSLKEVHFVLYDQDSVNVYNTVYAHEFP